MEAKKSFDLKAAVLGRITRLRYVVRFSICPRTHDESVAEHSFFTAYIGTMIAWDLHESGVAVNPGIVAMRALMHDIDEAHSGDFIRMFKHSSPSLKLAIDNASAEFMKQCAKETGSMAEYRLWEEAKDLTTEGLVVSFADFLSVVSYVVQEINAGNHSMFEHLDELKKFFSSFQAEKYTVLGKYLAPCQEILDTVEDRRTKI